VLHVSLSSELLRALNELILLCLVPLPEPLGHFRQALRLFEQFRQESDLDAAVKCVDIYESLLSDSGTDAQKYICNSPPLSSEAINGKYFGISQRRYHVLIQLARTLEERYQYAGNAHDLESATTYSAEALAMCHADNTICPTVRVFYSKILANNFNATTSIGELRMADMLCREAIPLCAAAHPLNAMLYYTLSGIVMRKYGQSGEEALINEAACLQRVGLERLSATESHSRHRHLRRLAQVLTVKLHHGGHADKDDIISIMSEAYQLCPPMHIDRSEVHTSMMERLLDIYHYSGELELLDRAIELGRQALSAGNFPNPERRAFFLFGMADILRTRHEIANRSSTDLDESIELFRESLQVSLPSDVNHWVRVNGLAQALVLQFFSDGAIGHLEEASQLYHYAGNIMSKANPSRATVMSGFAQSLGLRFRVTGDISELNRAIDLDEDAVAAWHPSAVNYADAALQMASHLCLRFEVINGTDDLEKEINIIEGLLKSLSDGNTDRRDAIHFLAKARLLHAINKNHMKDIDLSIEQLISIKDDLSRSAGGPESLRTLAACHLVKFRQSSVVDHALRAKGVINEVLESIIPDHYERFQCLIDAAELYMEHGTPYCNLDVALKHLSDAVGNSHRDVRSKIRGAKHVLDKLEMAHKDVFITKSSTSLRLLDIIASTVLLLPRISSFGIHPYSRLQSLKEGQSIAMIGSSHALNLSLPEKALEILEQGRAIFWTHTLRLRSQFDEIPSELRDRLVGLARRLEKVTSVSDSSVDQRHVGKEITQRRKESEEFNMLVEQVRCLPGLQGLTIPNEYTTFKKAAEHGPVVVLVCSSLACHAIVLEPFGEAVSIPLETITDKWLVESASVWRTAATEARLAMKDGRTLVKPRKNPDTPAERILRMLWINVVWPVIEVLRLKVRLRTICSKYEYSHV
jgi:tetratricopeptide (TPR) repeat protein